VTNYFNISRKMN